MMYFRAVTFLLAGLMLTACKPVPSYPENGVTKGPACSETTIAGMYMGQTYPAVDEGQGRVGLMHTGSGDLIIEDEAYGYYRLHDCRSGKNLGFDAYPIETRYKGAAVNLVEFVAAVRQDGLMSRPGQLLSTARSSGFKTDIGGWNAEIIDDYASCACQLFYPDRDRPEEGVK